MLPSMFWVFHVLYVDCVCVIQSFVSHINMLESLSLILLLYYDILFFIY